jgi:CRP-like cAMP-binding protein
MAALTVGTGTATQDAVPVVALEGLEPVYEATTAAELEAIWAFRYEIYVEELGRKLGKADHERHWVHDEDDDAPGVIHLYTRDDSGITGVQRGRFWAPGTVPAKDFAAFSMERFPGIEKLATGELGRLMVRRGSRGTVVLASLLSAAYEIGAGRLNADITFLNCAPGLVRLYRMLGTRPYSGRLVKTPDGSEVPMVLVMSDLAGMAAVNSLFLPLAQRHFGPGGRPLLDLRPLLPLLESSTVPLQDDPTAVNAFLQDRLTQLGETRCGLLETLSAETLVKLSANGMLLSLQEGESLLEEGLGQREVYIITGGLFEVLKDGQSVRVLSDGDVIGEVAFFSTSGRRTASVRAVSDGQVFVLRHSVLARLRKQDPACAAEILFHLARVLADRLAPLA